MTVSLHVIVCMRLSLFQRMYLVEQFSPVSLCIPSCTGIRQRSPGFRCALECIFCFLQPRTLACGSEWLLEGVAWAGRDSVLMVSHKRRLIASYYLTLFLVLLTNVCVFSILYVLSPYRGYTLLLFSLTSHNAAVAAASCQLITSASLFDIMRNICKCHNIRR